MLAARLRVGRYGQVDVVLVLQQAFLHHAGERGAQLGRRRLRDGDALERHVAGPQHRHHQRRARQRRRRGPTVLGHALAVHAQHVVELGRRDMAGGRRGSEPGLGCEQDDQRGHG